MSVKIKLTEAVELCNGTSKSSSITMREPKTNDLLNLNAINSNELKEITLISHLTGLPVDVLKDMSLKNYKRLQMGLEHLQGVDIDPKDYLSECSS